MKRNLVKLERKPDGTLRWHIEGALALSIVAITALAIVFGL